jgi:outer membrane lipoprotein SlyB
MRARPGRLRQLLNACLLAIGLTAAPALPQTIRIPDFRTQPSIFEPRPGQPCVDCGRVMSVREIPVGRKAALPTGFDGQGRGPADYNLVGAVVYLPLSNQSGDRPFVGGVGTPEMRERFGETTYELVVRMDDGATRIVSRRDGTRFRAGDRVRSTGPGELDLVLPD